MPCLNRSNPFIQFLLIVPSLLYRIAVGTRNKLYNMGILKSQQFDIPVISIGNITVGGTGKTPHTEHILSVLSDKMKVGMLSRGYMRKTKGFVPGDERATSLTIGDEPFQIKTKFKSVMVAVDKWRVRGIETMLQLPGGDELGAIVLDDAFQHRKVVPGISILITDFSRLFTKDCMLPRGNLREPAFNKKRAHIVIVSKCPENARPIDFRIITKELNLFPYQTLYFTKYEYEDLKPVFGDDNKLILSKKDLKGYDVLLVTGIVSPQYLQEYLEKYAAHIQPINYGDHHDFSKSDLLHIEKKFEAIENKNKIIITTEKDAARLLSNPDVPEVIKESLYCMPIKVAFLFDQEKNFNTKILDYVRKNKRNGGLLKK